MYPVLPRLYKKTSTGADQFWEIGYDGNTIITRWGQIDGKVQETRDVIAKGKNIGKRNETTPEQQALSEAQSQWEKKLKKGYVKDLMDARDGKVDDIIEGGVSPMLAHKFHEQGHKIKYPCYVQPKLDGHRCIAVVKGGKCTLWTRTRKPITSMTHIQAAIESLDMPDIVLDGELYNHDLKAEFEKLSSFIRDTEAKPGSEVMQYHIYDIANDQHFGARNFDLEVVSKKFPASLVYVETVTINAEDELQEAFQRFVGAGYEGAIARNVDGKYVNKRSYDLQKVKEFDDGEFEVIGVEEGRGKLAGHAVFVCKTDEGTEFRCKLKGEQSALKQYFDKPELVVGKHVTVEYFGITGKNKVPRFPVALRIREDL